MGWSRRAVVDGTGPSDITTVSIAIETNILLHNTKLSSLFILMCHLHDDIYCQYSWHLHGSDQWNLQNRSANANHGLDMVEDTWKAPCMDTVFCFILDVSGYYRKRIYCDRLADLDGNSLQGCKEWMWKWWNRNLMQRMRFNLPVNPQVNINLLACIMYVIDRSRLM